MSRRSKTANKEPKMVSFREYREIQRIKEAAHQGPGATEYLTPFGSEVKNKTDFGTKYKFVPNSNPPPGLYDTETGMNMVHPRTKFMAVPNREKLADFTVTP